MKISSALLSISVIIQNTGICNCYIAEKEHEQGDSLKYCAQNRTILEVLVSWTFILVCEKLDLALLLSQSKLFGFRGVFEMLRIKHWGQTGCHVLNRKL